MCKCRLLLSGTPGKMGEYIRAVDRAGVETTAQYAPGPEGCQQFDGLILCGGGDLSPALYGQRNRGQCREIDPLREDSDLALVAAFAEVGKPILGICRGMQLLNVAFGGTLWQDLGEGNKRHQGTGQGDRTHPLKLQPGSGLEPLLGADAVVNSSHHQAVADLAPGFSAAAWTADGVIEAIRHRTQPFWGVQFHPERMAVCGIFSAFVSCCRQS